MNHPETQLEDLIDRVVDGDLTPSRLRDAIGRIETSDDGWRRLALAFLEAQALGQVLREMDEAQPAIPASIPIRRPAIVAGRLALAASLAMLAFGLGWIGHGIRPTQNAGPMPVARMGETRPDAAGGTPAVPTAQLQHTAPGAGLPTPPEPPTEGLLAGDNVEIPLEEWLRDQPPPISSYEQAALEREGYRVEQRREVVLGTLDDGRIAAVPVDQVAVEYVGHLPL